MTYKQGELEFRWCDDIGMFAFDRPIHDIPEEGIEGSCEHKTTYCADHCYNNKLYKLYPDMYKRDVRNELAWQAVDGVAIKAQLNRKRRSTQRIRGCTRGENFKDVSDISRWMDILYHNPHTDWWMPTKAWRDPLLYQYIMKCIKPHPNVVVLASTDLTTHKDDWDGLVYHGWSTMFFGDNDMTHLHDGKAMFKCPKTWKDNMDGHCDICKAGCFRELTLADTVHVHLKEH